MAAATLAVRQLEAQQASRGAEGMQFKETDLSTAQAKVQKLQQRVAPYQQELQLRLMPSA